MPRSSPKEPPRVTISLLRRQLTIAQATIKALQMDRTDKEAVIAGYDAEVAERDELILTLQARGADQAGHIGYLQQENRHCSERLAFLEGYYAKSQETARPVFSSGPVLIRDQPQTYAGSGQGDAGHFEDGRQGRQSQGQEGCAAGTATGFGDQVRRQRPDHQRNQARSTVEHVEIKDWRDEVFPDLAKFT